MPRISDTAADPHDFCKRHFPNKRNAERRFGEGPDGPDGRGNCFEYNPDHPSYSDTGYRCESCKCLLTEADD